MAWPALLLPSWLRRRVLAAASGAVGALLRALFLLRLFLLLLERDAGKAGDDPGLETSCQGRIDDGERARAALGAVGRRCEEGAPGVEIIIRSSGSAKKTGMYHSSALWYSAGCDGTHALVTNPG